MSHAASGESRATVIGSAAPDAIAYSEVLPRAGMPLRAAASPPILLARCFSSGRQPAPSPPAAFEVFTPGCSFDLKVLNGRAGRALAVGVEGYRGRSMRKDFLDQLMLRTKFALSRIAMITACSSDT